jgi:hypothetical protein
MTIADVEVELHGNGRRGRQAHRWQDVVSPGATGSAEFAFSVAFADDSRDLLSRPSVRVTDLADLVTQRRRDLGVVARVRVELVADLVDLGVQTTDAVAGLLTHVPQKSNDLVSLCHGV